MATRSRTTGPERARRLARVLAATAVCACALALTGCSSGEGIRVEGPSAIPRAQAEADAEVHAEPLNAKPDPTPLKALDGVRVNIAEGQTVGVGTPISVTFDRPVPQAERADAEGQLKVVVDTGNEGSWSWVEGRDLTDGQRVDFRPRAHWKPGTKVTVRVGASLTRHFTVGSTR